MKNVHINRPGGGVQCPILGRSPIYLRCGLDTLQPHAGDRAFRYGWPLLEVLEHKLASRGPHGLGPVGPSVVGQTAPVGDSLDHFQF